MRRHRAHTFGSLAALLWLAGTGAAYANPIAVENALPGSPPSEWDVAGAGDASIQGFATEMSVGRGETVHFKVNTPATDYRIDVYRLGYYGGAGARHVATVQPSVSLPQTQPLCLSEPLSRLVDCGSWNISASWPVPLDAVSGIYVAKLVREDPEDGRASHIVFVVRDDTRGADILFQTSDTTWQAYNPYLGRNFYTNPRAYKVSYNRPLTLRGNQPWDGVFNAEYPMLRWLERNGYDVSYSSGVDTDRNGAELLEHRAFLSVGHDEYWSRGQRQAVESARDAGVHLVFSGGNEVYWKTRWEPSLDPGTTPHRTLVCYKESHGNSKIDPLPNVWTGWWRDCRFSPPADGCEPENALTGSMSWSVGLCGGTACGIQVGEEYARMRLWRHTDIETLLPGQTASFPAGTLGHEWNYEQALESNPPGLVWLSTTTVGSQRHHLTLYRHTSGAFVFGAGTIQWSWGLDATHTAGRYPPTAGMPADARMQQATANLFAEMGITPATPQPGLVFAPSGDAVPPVSNITFPAPGDSMLSGPVLIHGTAADTDGVVGVVEVSTDGGATWARAEGRETWSSTWFAPPHAGAVNLRCRAADDLGNLESPGAGVTVQIGGAPIEIAKAATDDVLYRNGIDVAHIEIATVSNSIAADSLEILVSVTSHLGQTFGIGTHAFALAPLGRSDLEFMWPLPAAADPQEFTLHVELRRAGVSLQTVTRPAAFTGMLLSRDAYEAALATLLEPAGCLPPGAISTARTLEALPFLGTWPEVEAALPVLCRVRAAEEDERWLEAGAHAAGAWVGAALRLLRTLPGEAPSGIVPNAVRNAIACSESLLARGLQALEPEVRIDSLGAAVAAAFAEDGRGYSHEFFVRGPAEVRLGLDGRWTTPTALALRDVTLFDAGEIAWGHVGPEPTRLGTSAANATARIDVELRSTSYGDVEVALLHGSGPDSTSWIRYEPIPFTFDTTARSSISSQSLYPWGFGLFVDWQGDGHLDTILYPLGMRPSPVTTWPESRLRLLPATPNPFRPETTVRFVLPEPATVRVSVLDVRGRVVRSLTAGPHAAGAHAILWDGRAASGRRLAAGIYFVQLASPWGHRTQKLTILR